MSRVFILQPPTRKRDLSSAQRYGTIVYLIDDPEFQPSLSPAKALTEIINRLQEWDYKPERDYLVFTGGDSVGALMLGQSASIFGRVSINNIQPKFYRTLRWDRELQPDGTRAGGFYTPVVVPLALDMSLL